jgi:hypothetical protein
MFSIARSPGKEGSSRWDPLFGTHSTQRVLDLTHPVPDAAAGVIAYATEVVLLLTRRGRLVLGVVLAAGAITSIALIIIQPAVVGAWCTLCLASAVLSLVLLVLGRQETADALSALRQPRRALRIALAQLTT